MNSILNYSTKSKKFLIKIKKTNLNLFLKLKLGTSKIINKRTNKKKYSLNLFL